MLRHLGLYLREKYNSTLQPMDRYDPVRFSSRSTSIPRTMQSGAAMLRGLFANLEGTPNRVYPVIHSRPIDEDARLLVWNGVPSVLLWTEAIRGPFAQLMENLTSSLIDTETLRVLGAETGLGELCTPTSHKYNNFLCAMELQDLYNCAASAGNASLYPLTGRYFDTLTQVLMNYNLYSMWGYDDVAEGGHFVKAFGTLGFNLAVDIVAHAQMAEPARPVLRHYSGHDTTLMPLWMTLGNYSLTNPLFGAAMVFEFSKEVATNVTYVKATMGAPGQLPGNHTYAFEPYRIFCTDAANNTYASTEHCPLDDFSRFIESRGPSVPNADCFFMPTWMPWLSCDPAETRFNYSRPCVNFRKACRSACGEDNAMRTNLSCVILSAP